MASEGITLGELSFGRYHAALVVYGESPDAAIENGAKMESIVSTYDTSFVRSTITNVYSWFAQFPAYLGAGGLKSSLQGWSGSTDESDHPKQVTP